jgi:hypothetical protein
MVPQPAAALAAAKTATNVNVLFMAARSPKRIWRIQALLLTRPADAKGRQQTHAAQPGRAILFFSSPFTK